LAIRRKENKSPGKALLSFPGNWTASKDGARPGASTMAFYCRRSTAPQNKTLQRVVRSWERVGARASRPLTARIRHVLFWANVFGRDSRGEPKKRRRRILPKGKREAERAERKSRGPWSSRAFVCTYTNSSRDGKQIFCCDARIHRAAVTGRARYRGIREFLAAWTTSGPRREIPIGNSRMDSASAARSLSDRAARRGFPDPGCALDLEQGRSTCMRLSRCDLNAERSLFPRDRSSKRSERVALHSSPFLSLPLPSSFSLSFSLSRAPVASFDNGMAVKFVTTCIEAAEFPENAEDPWKMSHLQSP